jgi:hypothetical protein
MASDRSDSAGGGSGSTYADRGFRGDVLSQLHGHNSRHAGMLHTPTATANMHHPSMEKWPSCAGWSEIAQGKLPTPRASDAARGPEITKATTEGTTGVALNTALEMGRRETLPSPTKRDKRDKRMDAWSPAYDKRKSPTMDAVMDGALTDRASDKWAYARMIAAILTEHGLSGASRTLPVTYGWMLGYSPGHISRFYSMQEEANASPGD